jgi:hypothetical protein
MDKKDVLEQHNVDEGYGIILGPDKFEGEMWYAPIVYDDWMNGFLDDVPDSDGDESCGLLKLDAETRKEFEMDEDDDTVAILIQESNDGFVYLEHLNASELTELEEGK